VEVGGGILKSIDYTHEITLDDKYSYRELDDLGRWFDEGGAGSDSSSSLRIPGMEELLQLKCVACRKGAPTVTEDEVGSFLPQVPEWDITALGGIQRLERTYRFKDFGQALFFTNQVGELAEAEGHHPALLTEWGRVKVTWWTHKIRGLHRNDFIMAAKTDQLFSTTLKREAAETLSRPS